MVTTDLLAIVLGLDGSRPSGNEAIAGLIDRGDCAFSADHPAEIALLSDLPHDRALVLAAAFELSRRLVAPRRPTAVRGPADVAAIACRELGDLRRERVLVVVCDSANRPLQTVVVCDGAIDRSLMPVREILNAVLRRDGRAFAIAHNHPCGDPEPSDADVAATRRVADGARLVGLRFLGHVVVGDGRWAVIAT